MGEGEHFPGFRACSGSLTSIQESAWGSDQPRVDLPAVTFTYGSASFGQGALRYPPETQPSPDDDELASDDGWGTTLARLFPDVNHFTY